MLTSQGSKNIVDSSTQMEHPYIELNYPLNYKQNPLSLQLTPSMLT